MNGMASHVHIKFFFYCLLLLLLCDILNGNVCTSSISRLHLVCASSTHRLLFELLLFYPIILNTNRIVTLRSV